ncbi:MAG: hypothetical protein ACHQ1H_09190 [Nitrososphaerales archaeon]
MAVLEQSPLKQTFSKWKPERIAEIIDGLSGGKSNLKVDVHNIRLIIGDKEYELAGSVDFDAIQKNGISSFDALNATHEIQRKDSAPAFESGKVLVSTGDLEVLEINVAGKRWDVDVKDKQFIKRVIKLRNEIAPQNSNTTETKARKQKKSSNPLAIIRAIAEACKKLGITVTISYRGHRIATMGAEARPMLLQYVTKTHALALNSAYTAIEMMI